MNWKLKAFALAALDRAPFGAAIYHRLQKVVGTNRINFDESLRRAANLIRLIEETGGKVRDSAILEIGSGWRPIVPFILKLADARKVLTLDIHPWMDRSYVVETYCALRDNLSQIAAELSIPYDELESRFPLVDVDSLDWREILARFEVDYRCPADARFTNLGDASVDIVLSSNVLEHVAADDLAAIHKESLRILKCGGLAVHRFNPEDHFAAVDRGITRVNFLRFSEERWSRIARGLAFHNRLRCPQHRDLMEHAGFEIVVARTRIDTRSLEAILAGHIALHPDFQHFSPKDLAGDYMWLVGRKP